MQTVRISAEALMGVVTPPPFKSEVIRVLILSALSGVAPQSVIEPYKSAALSDDILNAVSAVEAALVCAAPTVKPIFAGESATLLRLLAPVLLAKHGRAVFAVSPSLYRRSLSALADCIGCRIDKYNGDTIEFTGDIFSDRTYSIDASSSSQLASGLILAGAVIPRLRLNIKDAVSLPYIDLTLKCMDRFGVEYLYDENTRTFESGTSSALTRPDKIEFEPDLSYAANFIAANYLMSGAADAPIRIEGRAVDSRQPDAVIIKLLGQHEFSVRDCPDLFPILAVCALAADEPTVIHDALRLSDKESDRIASTRTMAESLGGSFYLDGDSVIVHGPHGRLHGGIVDSFGDHRIVMAAAIASLICDGQVIIKNCGAVSKSAPQFFSDFRSLGGTVDEYYRQ